MSEFSTMKLTTTNCNRFRSFATRVALKLSGVPFEDEVLTWPAYMAARGDKTTFPLGQIPVLRLPSGKVITQSGALARYAGELSGLYPRTSEEQLICDEIVEVCAETMNACPGHKDPEEKKRLREAFAVDVLPKYFEFLASRSNGSYFVGDKLTIADLAFYGLAKSYKTGTYDHVPADCDAQWPAIQAFVDMMEADPRIAPYKL